MLYGSWVRDHLRDTEHGVGRRGRSILLVISRSRQELARMYSTPLTYDQALDNVTIMESEGRVKEECCLIQQAA